MPDKPTHPPGIDTKPWTDVSLPPILGAMSERWWCALVWPEPKGRSRATLLLEARWQKGRKITISFLDGDEVVHERIRKVAQQWIDRTGARLTFEWRKDISATDIRISFRYAGSWSMLGKFALEETDVTRPTMNFGWLTRETSDPDLQEVALHEFGHAIGLLHEHQSPNATIPWNEGVVLAELSGPPNNWSEAEIRRNVLDRAEGEEVRATPFDPASIMLYPINPRWTIDGYSTSRNSDLSESDIALVRAIYGK
jgi:serralysin